MKISSIQRFIYLLAPLLVTSLAASCSSQRGAVRGDEPVPIIIGVVDFEAENMNLTQARAVTDRVLFNLAHKDRLTVIERDKMESVLREVGFRGSGSCSTNECITQVGRILGAGMMVAGEVSKAGDFYHLEIRLIDVAQGSMINHAFCDVRGIEDLLTNGTEGVVNDLLADIIPGDTASH